MEDRDKLINLYIHIDSTSRDSSDSNGAANEIQHEYSDGNDRAWRNLKSGKLFSLCRSINVISFHDVFSGIC